MILRWIKFATVGAAGLAVQLAMLWMLTRGAFPIWLATAIAVETAVLHNFVWHEVWTWRGHPRAMRLKRLWRFHLATGIISILSNTVLTVAFKQWLPIPLLAANVLAVGATAILNFLVADRWIFKPLPLVAAPGARLPTQHDYEPRPKGVV